MRVSVPAISVPAAPTIRLATPADVLPMAKVHIIAWRETYPGLLPAPMLERLSISREAIRRQRLFDRPHPSSGATSFVADDQEAIVGYGSCGRQRSDLLNNHGFTAEIGELYILRCAQRQGVGSGLMKAMAAVLLDRGHRSMSLWVLEQNAPARRFYERLGGAQIAQKRGGPAEVAYGWPNLRLLGRR